MTAVRRALRSFVFAGIMTATKIQVVRLLVILPTNATAVVTTDSLRTGAPSCFWRDARWKAGLMPSVRQVEKRIEEVEGFRVRFLSPEGTDLARRHIDDYSYARAANKAWTVAKWRKSRFTPSYTAFGVEVLDGDGNPVHGKTLLSTMRDT